jgi:hypothetical protein
VTALGLPLDLRDLSAEMISTAETSRASGGEGIRTPGLLRAREALCQLSYTPSVVSRDQITPSNRSGSLPLPTVGLCGLEPQTSVLSGPRSNHLS